MSLSELHAPQELSMPHTRKDGTGRTARSRKAVLWLKTGHGGLSILEGGHLENGPENGRAFCLLSGVSLVRIRYR